MGQKVDRYLGIQDIFTICVYSSGIFKIFGGLASVLIETFPTGSAPLVSVNCGLSTVCHIEDHRKWNIKTYQNKRGSSEYITGPINLIKTKIRGKWSIISTQHFGIL